MKKNVRIAIYSRKSKYSDKGDSCKNQIELAMEYIKNHYPSNEYEVEVILYEDEGFSGGNIERPEFQKMLKEENINPFDVLICYRLDRISRNIADFSNIMNELTRLHTDFVSIKEQFDTRTPMGRAMMYIASVFAQLEREVIAERIRDNMIELAKTGRWLGGETPTGFNSERYDLINIYEKNNDNTLERKSKKACKLVENEKERKVIETIFKKYLEIKSLNGTESYLIQHNILSRKGVYFATGRIRTILTSLVYATYDEDMEKYLKSKGITIFVDDERKGKYGKYGLIAYNKQDGHRNCNDMSEWIVAVGLHPGYIKGADWIKIQQLIEKNTSRRYNAKSKNEALFSGIVKCSQCGSYMRPKMTGNQPKDAEQKRFYYTCELKERSRGTKCQGANIVGLTMDSLVIEKLREVFVPSSEVYKELKNISITKQNNDIKEELQGLYKNLNKNKEEIKRIIEKLKYIDNDVVEFVNEELRKKKKENEEVQNKIDILENGNKERENKEHKNKKKLESKGAKLILDIVDNCFNQFEDLDIKTKKDILKILIQDIEGNGDKVVINMLNTKIDECSKKLFSDMVTEGISKKK